MKLFSLTGATVVHHDGVTYEPDKDGGFDLPPDLVSLLAGSAVDRRPQWENDLQRQDRVASEDLAKRQSPEALYDAVAKIAELAHTGGQGDGSGPARRAPAKRAAATKE